MAIEVTPFDSLVQGDGYANPQCPATDAAPDQIASTQHVPDSYNDSMNMVPTSLATTNFEAPANPAPYWNSGHGENVVILDGDK